MVAPQLIRLPLLALAVLTLTGCRDFTSGVDAVQAALTGEAQPEVYALANDVPSVEPVVEPEPPAPVCETYMWRYMLYTCDGTLIGPDPRYE